MGLEWSEATGIEGEKEEIVWKTLCSSGVADVLKVSNDMQNGCGIIMEGDDGECVSVWMRAGTVDELIEALIKACEEQSIATS